MPIRIPQYADIHTPSAPTSRTETYGRNTGTPFSIYPDHDATTVKTLEIWEGRASGDSAGLWVIKGLRITWFNDQRKQLYNHPQDGDQLKILTFATNETMTECSIRAAWRVDRIEIVTSRGQHLVAGGEGGTPYRNVARGSLVGYTGSAGWEVDNISVLYR
ncbi:hypothetical protein BO82DRAFT_191241 [Aspergillus uvarum CBS 121591]|uniref:Jacalin-type lectin domain-containing protein n=1 Tax=Aspergillus uvarum CBS 121591 TaxID=1448315 RepID=A0A319BXT2_9EURO|nr:hypothetical protein BO82DRAFT_191241 [Aspergillus uvarum CBS 121591]PYH76987.1 hypothetical protein BO82DRAFT_191241 [Aspergillus uvarum CBS 121591]